MPEVAPAVPEVGLRFDALTSDRELEDLRDAWSRLDDGAAPGAVFRSWEWQATWWRVLGGARGRRRELRLIVARDATGVRAILPLYREEVPVGGLVPRRRVGLLADGVVGSDYLGLVAPAGEAAPLARAIADRLARDPALAGSPDGWDLCDLLDGDPLGEALGSALEAAGHRVERVPRYRCPVARLAGRSLEDYLAARPGGFGSQLAKRRARLRREPGFRLAIHDAPDDVVRDLPALFALHRARWAEEGGSEAILDAAVERFHLQAARALAERGRARLAILEARGAPLAAGYGFARAGRFAYYQAGITAEGRRLSAGTVLLGALIERAVAEGLGELDFLRGEEPYKAIWADDARTTHRLRAWAPTPRARRADRAERAIAAARVAARRILPPPAADALRRLARRWRRP